MSRLNQANPVSVKKGAELLGAVPFDKGFHFYIDYGKYTGVTANSIMELAQKLITTPAAAVTFHFGRGDFQKWLRNVIGDEELAARIDHLKDWPSWSSDEGLRKELLKTVEKRISELKPSL
ncbi:MAG: DUF5752 family protein [Candidatus Bathyarchaeia archaeon]